jgi:hypothetical protein
MSSPSVEVLGVERKRRFTFEEKERIVAETAAPGGTEQIALKFTRPGSTRTVTITTISLQLTPGAGLRTTATGSCSIWPAVSRRQGLASVGNCELSSGTGTFSLSFACKTTAEAGALDCTGETRGATGAHLGKTGTMSWRTTANANGTRSSTGTGNWN